MSRAMSSLADGAAAPVEFDAIDQCLSQVVVRYSDNIALRFNDEVMTYAELECQVNQTAVVLQEVYAIQKGDRIAWYGMNHPEMLVLLFAASKVGCILVPLNWRLALPELSYIAKDCTPRVIFHDHHFIAEAQCLVQELSALSSDAEAEGQLQNQNQLEAQDFGSSINLVSSCLVDELQDGIKSHQNDSLTRLRLSIASEAKQAILCSEGAQSDPLAVVYTSGTTGQPKGAVLGQQSFLCNARMSRHMHGMTSDDHVLGFLPLFHVGGFNIQLLPALLSGATVTLLEKFDPETALKTIEQQSVTLAVVVPTILQAILSSKLWNKDGLKSLRALAIGSTDVPMHLIKSVHGFGIPLLQIYGTTETSPLAIYQRIEHVYESVGSIGQCGQECEIRLVDNAGNDVATGGNGEIWVKGKQVFSQYWNNSEATNKALTNGWFHTGDVACCDENGFYWFADRLKHVIISGGENIYAAELERIIRDFSEFQDLVVVGRPDEKWGEVPVVVAVCDDLQHIDHTRLRDKVLSAFEGKIARFKHPRDVVFVDELPKTALGKIQADKVRALLNI